MARERYLIDGEEEKIHSEEKKIELVTKKDKWSNFWFYYKKHVIIGVVLLLILGLFIHDMASKVEPDYTIAIVVGDGYMTDEQTQELKTKLTAYAEDVNGDGKIDVSISIYNLMLGNSVEEVDVQLQQANIYRFVGNLTTNESVLFITDTMGFEYCQKDEDGEALGYLDGTRAEKDAKDLDKIRLPMSKLPFMKDMQSAALFENYAVSLRYFTPGQMKNEKTAARYAADKALLDRLMAGEPLR